MIKQNNNSGFSLVELIIAVAILVVLTLALIPSFIREGNEARAAKDETKFESICTAFKSALAEPEVRNEMDNLSSEGDIIIVCHIGDDGLIKFADGTLMYNNMQSSMDLDQTKLWINSRQSIGATYEIAHKRFAKQYLVFHITPKTSTTTAMCEYEICKESP